MEYSKNSPYKTKKEINKISQLWQYFILPKFYIAKKVLICLRLKNIKKKGYYSGKNGKKRNDRRGKK